MGHRASDTRQAEGRCRNRSGVATPKPMKPRPLIEVVASVFAMTPSRGLSLSR
jgi:hypothetical protein